jgi:hypothetical protein
VLYLLATPRGSSNIPHKALSPVPNRKTTWVTCGAICLSSSSHLPAIESAALTGRISKVNKGLEWCAYVAAVMPQ